MKINLLTFSGFSLFLFFVTILPAKLKTRTDGIELAGTARTVLAT
jgi:hypothetical protein